MPTLISQPSTPIAERIISSQNDPSFWQSDTPTIPPLPSPRPLPPTPDQWPGMTSLLPPPRRSSKHITAAEIPDSEAPTIPAPTPKPPAAENEHRLISLSRPGSVVSLGIVNFVHFAHIYIYTLYYYISTANKYTTFLNYLSQRKKKYRKNQLNRCLCKAVFDIGTILSLFHACELE